MTSRFVSSTRPFPSARKTRRVSGICTGPARCLPAPPRSDGPERLVPVGTTKRTAVMGTTVRDLQDVTVCLARRPDDHAVVSHGPIIARYGFIKSPALGLPPTTVRQSVTIADAWSQHRRPRHVAARTLIVGCRRFALSFFGHRATPPRQRAPNRSTHPCAGGESVMRHTILCVLVLGTTTVMACAARRRRRPRPLQRCSGMIRTPARN